MSDEPASANGKTYPLAIALIVGMFAIWGMAHRLYDTLLPQFAAALALDDFRTSLAQWSLSFGYFLMALPAAMITRTFGYKSGVVFGLGCFAVGMFIFYPAAQQHEYLFFLVAAVVVGSGLTILEVSADPLIVRLGPPQTAVRRLNIAQALNPIGVLVGFFVGQWVLDANMRHPVAQLAHSLVLPYFMIGGAVLLFAFVVDKVEFPSLASERVSKGEATIRQFSVLLKQHEFRLGAAAQFLCSVAQVVLWGFTVRYAQKVMPGLSEARAADIVLWSLIAFTMGRVVGTALMYVFNPSLMLAAFSAAGAALTAASAFATGEAGIACIIGASFFLSIVFPTIFASTIRDLGPFTKSGSAILMFAAGGGAAVLAITNLLWPSDGMQYVMIVPGIAFALITAFALRYHAADRQRDSLGAEPDIAAGAEAVNAG